jgi:hypothetical protein
MAFWHKRDNPIDRCVEDLDRQIAALQFQARRLEHDPSARSEASAPDGAQRNRSAEPLRKWATPTSRAITDLAAGNTELLDEVEATPIAFAKQTEPDLFTRDTATAHAPPKREWLGNLLGVGAVRSYKPLKYEQRLTRNRFFMWLGCAVIALCLIYLIIH